MLSDTFHYAPITVNNIDFIPIHHPSYILVYKRKLLDEYIKQVQAHFQLPSGQARIVKKNLA